MKKSSLTYKDSGVNYDLLDDLKRLAQSSATDTEKNIADTPFCFHQQSRGESASVFEQGDMYFTFVQEGLGTKTLVADTMFEITGKTYYDQIAQDTVAMSINDLITVGSRPVGIFAYWAVGDSEWLKNKKRLED